MRVGEACKLMWTDVDQERSLISVNHPEKHGNPRSIRVSKGLIAMLN